MIPRCGVNAFGDLICPHCSAQLITPANRVPCRVPGSASLGGTRPAKRTSSSLGGMSNRECGPGRVLLLQ